MKGGVKRVSGMKSIFEKISLPEERKFKKMCLFPFLLFENLTL